MFDKTPISKLKGMNNREKLQGTDQSLSIPQQDPVFNKLQLNLKHSWRWKSPHWLDFCDFSLDFNRMPFPGTKTVAALANSITYLCLPVTWCQAPLVSWRVAVTTFIVHTIRPTQSNWGPSQGIALNGEPLRLFPGNSLEALLISYPLLRHNPEKKWHKPSKRTRIFI